MDYKSYLKNEYTYSLPNLSVGENAIYCFLQDGNKATFSYDDLDNDTLVEELLYYVTNKVNRDYSQTNIVAFEVFRRTATDSFTGQYFLTTCLDYCVVGGTYLYQAGYYDNIQTDTIVNADNDSNYYTSNNVNFSDYTYGRYTGYVSGTYSVYDLTNYKYDSADYSYRTDALAVRGENTSYYKHTLMTFNYSTSSAQVYFAYGSPYSDIANSEYERGVGNGYASGWADGNQNGYDIGLNSHVDQNTYTAFGYVMQAFNSVGGIMSLEVLPHVSLGLCFSIPLVLVLIMTIFRLVKK